MIRDSSLSVGLIGVNDQNRLAITRELAGPDVGVLRDFYRVPLPEELAELLEQKLDLLIVDVDHDVDNALQFVERLAALRVATVMVYSSNPEADLVKRCLFAGAHEFLDLPLKPGQMAGALVRAAARRPESARRAANDPELFVFFGVKGGVGVTTIATNFALLLAEESTKKTLLIDLDLPLGDTAINLGLNGKFSTLDALQNINRLDTNFLSSLLQTYKTTLSVLAAPGEFVNFLPDSGSINKLIAVAKQDFDYVVVDSGSRLNFFDTELYRDAACVYMVTQTGVPELRNANRLVKQFPQEGRTAFQIVINRYTSSYHGLDEKTVAAALTRPADWKIPNDYVTAFRTQNTSTPLGLENTPISRIIRQMARVACGKAQLEDAKKAQQSSRPKWNLGRLKAALATSE